MMGSQNLDQDPNDPSSGAPPIDADDLINFVQICLKKLDPDEQEKFVSALSDMISAPGMDGSNGTLQITHRPNGNDNGLNNGPTRSAQERPAPEQPRQLTRRRRAWIAVSSLSTAMCVP